MKELKRDERDRKYRKRGKEKLEVGFEGWGRYHFQFAAIMKACECKARRAQKPNNSGFPTYLTYNCLITNFINS